MADNEDKKEDNTPFNGSLDTLSRINQLIIDISDYRINQHWIGLRENLGELLNEAQGCLSKGEYEKAWKDWESIEALEITINSDGTLTYDDSVPFKLKKFSSWLRLKLYKHNLTMAKSFGSIDKMANLSKRYNL